MLTQSLSKTLSLPNSSFYMLSSPSFSRSEPLWQKCRGPVPTGYKNARYPYYKLGKTFGLQINRYIEYFNGVFYYYDSQDGQCKGYSVLENLYMTYFYNGTHYVLYLTNGVQSSVFYFSNNSFMNHMYQDIVKYVIQVQFKLKYQLIQQIGEGTFSKVYLAINRITNKKYAVKIMPKIDSSGFNTKQLVLQQKKILRYLNSATVCKMHEFFQDNDSYIFILQLISGKDLSKILKQQKQSSISTNISILKQVLQSLQYIHSHNIIHRDLKPHNIIVEQQSKINEKEKGKCIRNGNVRVKLIDFGLSLMYNQITPLKKFMRCGTMGYIAPEIVNNQGERKTFYDCKADMFGFGIIAHMLLMGTNPIRGNTYKETVQKNRKCLIDLDRKVILLRYGRNCLELLEGCLQTDPKKRLSASQALCNKFFEQRFKDEQTVTNTDLGDDSFIKHKNQQLNYIEDKQFVGNMMSSTLTFNSMSKLPSLNNSLTLTNNNINNKDLSEMCSPKKTAPSWISASKISSKMSGLSGIL